MLRSVGKMFGLAQLSPRSCLRSENIFIGLYLGSSSISSSFGAAGALILILVWVYYSTTIFLFGAEFTKVYADQFGSGIHPSRNACFVDQARPCAEIPSGDAASKS